MRKILIIAGTRPEIIKLAPVALIARQYFSAELSVTFCFTGQHKTMAEDAMKPFGLTPDIDLGIMKPGQTLNGISEEILRSIPKVFSSYNPDIVMVQGDTTSAAVAGLAAFNSRISVAHVEAGLRSGDLSSPFPEECNRKLISCFADYNFAPTERAFSALAAEGVSKDKLYLTGNTVVDAVRIMSDVNKLQEPRSLFPSLRSPYVLVTAHRRESFGIGFEKICSAIASAAKQLPDFQFLYPVHLNPQVQNVVMSKLSALQNVLLVPPVPYLELLSLLAGCSFVLTDSGGIQEEAPSFKKHCIVMREVTERMEAVDAGISELVGTDTEKILNAILVAAKYPASSRLCIPNPFGDGKASERICNILSK